MSDPLQKLDEFTSPVHNPIGVCISFNLVFVLLFLSLAALVYLGESKPAVFVFFSLSVILWLSINLFLYKLSTLPPPTTPGSKKQQ
ncbi:hypothetical protein BASA81_008062 [Batrachochytrium salamandrivorans]|nr:hypothetical protein BASA81_008062 [Batrachochytrium salamandrivorans]